MATIKCKMCGGTMEISDNSTVAVCEYCGTQQTIPRISYDRKAMLYDRASYFRRNNEYDKAQGIYEQILNEDPNDAESYWSLVLCKYGIEYVEDPATHKRVPTVNRTQFTSIYEDANYKEAIKHSDDYQRSIYEEEAKAIDDIQKGILQISKKEEPFDIFICYKETDNSGKRTRDSVIAQELYNELIKEGFKVFFSRITLESKLGTAYEPYIFAALNSSKVMVVVGTKPEYLKAVWVKNEWSRFLEMAKKGEKKALIPAYRDMDPYDLPEEFSFLQALDMSKLGFMQDLVAGIKKLIEGPKSAAVSTDQFKTEAQSKDKNPFLKRARLYIEEKDFDNASEYIRRFLDTDPENPEAYYLSFLCKNKLTNLSKYTNLSSFLNDKDILYAYRFSDVAFKNFLDKQKECVQSNMQYLNKLLQSYSFVRSGGGLFKKEIQDVEKQIREVNTQKQKLSILKLEISRLSSDSSEKKARLDDLRKQHHEKENRLSICGTFAFKQKKEIKEEINIILNKISELESNLKSIEKNQISADQSIKMLPNETLISDRIEKLSKKKEEWERKKEKAENEILFDGDLQKLEDSIHEFFDFNYRTGVIGPAGGYIFYDKGSYSDGWRFLEAAPADLRIVDGVPTVDASVSGYSSAKFEFDFGMYRKSDDGKDLYVNGTRRYEESNCTGTAVGTGKRNTCLLVSTMGNEAFRWSDKLTREGAIKQKTANYAARMCSILSYPFGEIKYNDWFLPSKEELNLMYECRMKIGGFATDEYSFYWSSSESDSSIYYAWFQIFDDDGKQLEDNRDALENRVRPIRAF